jgi:hypothetical protein
MEQKLEFSSAHKRMLRELTITADRPGTILHDFEAMLSYLRAKPLRATRGHQLPLRVLPELNARLAHPIQLGLQRPVQKSFPHINGLYLLVRASGLVCVEHSSKKPLLVVDDEVYQSWAGLNPTERYCTLLETWLLRGSLEIIGEERWGWAPVPQAFYKWKDFFWRVPAEGMPIAGDAAAEDLISYVPMWHNLGLLELFGLLAVHHGAPQPGQGWRVERVRRTPLGDALSGLLYTGFFGDLANVFALEDEEQIRFGVLQSVLQPCFPAWKKNLIVPEWTFREGTYVFKVELYGIWRRIAIPAGLTLDSLASAILDAVEFDDDHLYLFRYRTRSGRMESVHHPFMDDGPWTSEVLVGDLPLGVGQEMTYLFDFGDNWEFKVTLERIDPPDASIKAPVVLESQGEPFEQYRRWDDWS